MENTEIKDDYLRRIIACILNHDRDHVVIFGENTILKYFLQYFGIHANQQSIFGFVDEEHSDPTPFYAIIAKAVIPDCAFDFAVATINGWYPIVSPISEKDLERILPLALEQRKHMFANRAYLRNQLRQQKILGIGDPAVMQVLHFDAVEFFLKTSKMRNLFKIPENGFKYLCCIYFFADPQNTEKVLTKCYTGNDTTENDFKVWECAIWSAFWEYTVFPSKLLKRPPKLGELLPLEKSTISK